MASIRRHKGRWRAEIMVAGRRRSKVCATRREAQEWAREAEWQMRNPGRAAAQITLAELLDRYARERTPAKRGARAEGYRLAALARDRIGKLALGELGSRHIADWRGRRLREVSPTSVRRDMEHLSTVLRCARLEWELIDRDVMAGVKRPAANPERSRLPTFREMRRIALVAPGLDQRTGRAWWAFRFACRTAMRQGEVCALRWEDVTGQVAHLRMTKNGRPRDVPLSRRALRLLDEIRPVTGDGPLVADLRADVCSTLWRRLCERAGVDDLHWHDSRHFAATVLSRRLGPMELARVTGHRDLRVLLRVYYDETPERLARRMG